MTRAKPVKSSDKIQKATNILKTFIEDKQRLVSEFERLEREFDIESSKDMARTIKKYFEFDVTVLKAVVTLLQSNAKKYV